MATILVVDDDRDLLEMVETALTLHGFAITTLRSGKTLMEVLPTVNPDLILLDIYLDENLDGRHLCTLIRADEVYKNLPVILYSARTVPNESISHATAFINKPFEIRNLVEMINAVISKN